MRRRTRRLRDEGALDVTPFLNLMVILVPFLLMTAVFQQVAVLPLALPGEGAARAVPPAPVQVRLLADGRLRVHVDGHARTLAAVDGGPDLAAFQRLLVALKGERPERRRLLLTLPPQTPYATVVALMDRARQWRRPEGVVALFPEIGLARAEGRGR